jgi:hypothetical protein
MLAVSLVFGSFLTILFLVVGLIGGWTAREYMMNYREVPRPHPEMFDNQGNLIPDEVIAFNFENYYDDSEEDDINEYFKTKNNCKKESIYSRPPCKSFYL